MLKFLAQIRPHEILTIVVAVGSLIVSIYSMSLSWKTMTLLHRPFLALLTPTLHEIEPNVPGPPIPLGASFPLANIQRVRVGFVIENTGTALAQNLVTGFSWTQGNAEWSTPTGGASEVVPKQQRTILVDIPGDAVRQCASGATLKAVFTGTFTDALGDPFETTHYIHVLVAADGNMFKSLIFLDLPKQTWLNR